MKTKYINLLPQDEEELTMKRVKQLKEGKIYNLSLDDQDVIAAYDGISEHDGQAIAVFKELDENEQENGYSIEVFIDEGQIATKYKGKKK